MSLTSPEIEFWRAIIKESKEALRDPTLSIQDKAAHREQIKKANLALAAEQRRIQNDERKSSGH